MTTQTVDRAAAEGRTDAPVPGQSFALLLRTELRKAVDTRSGRVVLLAVVGLSLAAIGYRIVNAADSPVTFARFIESSVTPVQILLPVVGILAMTSEWTQRTALTTFTLSPRRLRVLVAKLLSAVVLATVLVLVVVALTLLGTIIGGAVAGTDPAYTDAVRLAAGALLGLGLYVLMGAAFGALVSQTAVAMVAFYVAPTAWNLLAGALLKERSDWLDVFLALSRVSQLRFSENAGQTVTSLAVWVVLPTVVGLGLAARREVK